jgi:hypothetical protein
LCSGRVKSSESKSRFRAKKTVSDASRIFKREQLRKRDLIFLLVLNHRFSSRSMEHFSDALWQQYLARPADDKFTLVCIVHNAFAVEWLTNWGADWVREGALRIMPISDQ